MTAAIALNRFGLGARADDPLPPEPRRWLVAQLDRFDPRPQALRSVPGRAQVAADLARVAEQRRMELREARQQTEQGASQRASRPAQQARGYATIRDHYWTMSSARLASAVATATPFAERLVHFWANHFAVSADRPPMLGLAGPLEFEAIRGNLLGRFSDMLVAVEQHPAMLIYLDQAQSVGPDSPAGRFAAQRGGPRGGLNENLAREILELHTLGVGGGYSQADVTELARALTGWTVAGIPRGVPPRFLAGAGPPGSFAFVEALHQPGTRRILGRTYAQPGERQARAVLADVAAHPSTARHLATKLARHFAGDEPPPPMVERLTRAYLSSGGDLPTVYRAIIDSPEPWVQRPIKFKTPWEWTVSSLRALGGPSLAPAMTVALLTRLGQATWRPGSPAGWDDKGSSWAGPDALMRRVDAAGHLASRVGARIDPRALAERILPGALSQATRTAIARAETPAQGLALLLVSPEFLRR